MCLAVPGKVVSKGKEKSVVDFEGIQKEIITAFVDAEVGDLVLVHAGTAIQKVEEKDASKVLEDFYES